MGNRGNVNRDWGRLPSDYVVEDVLCCDSLNQSFIMYTCTSESSSAPPWDCFPSLWQKEDVRQEYKVSELPLELCSVLQAHLWKSYTFSSWNRSWSALSGEQNQSFLQIQRSPVHISFIHTTDLDSLMELPFELSSSRCTDNVQRESFILPSSFLCTCHVR